jgi:hypothetical protein
MNLQIQGGSDVPELTHAERQYLTETQSLTWDDAGQEVLAGLTDLESDLLMAYRRRLAAGNTDQNPENLSIWLDLAERHERARPLQTPAWVLRARADELEQQANDGPAA